MKQEDDRIIGMVLDGKYRVDEIIGIGGMGNVYKGVHLQLGVPIAVKTLHAALMDDEVSLKRFRREALLALSIKHPNAVTVLDFGSVDRELPYIVMEYIQGESLYQILEHQKRLGVFHSVYIIQQVCQALEVAHKLNIIHRDLKPANIMVTRRNALNEGVKVIDFSIAKMLYNEGDPDSNLTAKNIVLGTPEYISPEHAQNCTLTAQSDIYSLGIILYEMLTGEVPFKAKTTAGLFVKHVHEKPMPLRQIRPEIPLELDEAVLRALAKSPQDRPTSAANFAAQLQVVIEKTNLNPQDDWERAVTHRLDLTSIDLSFRSTLSMLLGQAKNDGENLANVTQQWLDDEQLLPPVAVSQLNSISPPSTLSMLLPETDGLPEITQQWSSGNLPVKNEPPPE